MFSNIKSTIARGWGAAQEWIAAGRLRRVRAVAFQVYVLVALVGFAALALLATTAPLFPPDIEVTRELQAEVPSWIARLLIIISWPGYTIQAITITALVAVLLSMGGLRWEAAASLITSIGCVALNYLVKIAIRRPRPEAPLVDVFTNLNTYSFPSGHVMWYTAFFGFLLFLAFTLLRRPWVRIAVMAPLIGMIALVGVSRIYLGEHWASDVVSGYLLGSLVLFVAIAAYRWGKDKFFVTQPVAGKFSDPGLTPAELDELRKIE